MTDYTRISIVTPTYNSADYLAQTLDSVLSQAYPALEYIVIDGDSDDGTQDIIASRADDLSYWHSESDHGMYDALQKGFERSTGEIMGYLNSDDMHFAHTLRTVNAIFRDLPDVMWISSLRPVIWNQAGDPVDVLTLPGFSKAAFLRGEYLANGQLPALYIQQESTFWRRALWDKVGARVNTALKLAGDFELWTRFYQHAPLIGVRTMLAGFRVRPGQLSATAADVYHHEAWAALAEVGGHRHNALSSALRRQAVAIPRRLRRPASWLGMTHKVQNAVYDLKQERWILRWDYV